MQVLVGTGSVTSESVRKQITAGCIQTRYCIIVRLNTFVVYLLTDDLFCFRVNIILRVVVFSAFYVIDQVSGTRIFHAHHHFKGSTFLSKLTEFDKS